MKIEGISLYLLDKTVQRPEVSRAARRGRELQTTPRSDPRGIRRTEQMELETVSLASFFFFFFAIDVNVMLQENNDKLPIPGRRTTKA